MSEDREIEWRTRTRHLKTARPVLRPWRLSDDAAVYAIHCAPEVARWVMPGPACCPRPLRDATQPLRDATHLARQDRGSRRRGLPVGRWAFIERNLRS